MMESEIIKVMSDIYMEEKLKRIKAIYKHSFPLTKYYIWLSLRKVGVDIKWDF